jgi:hypothetical protein
MPDISAAVEALWSDAAALPVAVELPWDDATAIASPGGSWTAPPAPPGGTPTGPNTDADFTIPAQDVYGVVHTVAVVDLRDSLAVEFDSMTLSCDEASVCWTLTASGPVELFDRFTLGDDLPLLEITIDGMVWVFVVESVRRSREFANNGVSVTGRSQTIYAGEPYQFAENWVNDGPTTAGQIAEQAQVFTALEVEWQLEDWPVPDRVWSFTGTPLAVVQRVAESVGAILRSARDANRIAVMPRYRLLPNEWSAAAPDVEIHIEAAITESYERSDRPAYNAVYVSGQQQGVTCFVRLAWTAGEKAAPLVTDLLITDLAAGQQRGVAELGAGGKRATIQMTLPVLTDAGAPGVLEVGWLCRIVDGFSKWWGLVRAVTVNVAFPSVMQTVTLERHIGFIEGSTAVAPAPPPPAPAPSGPTFLAWPLLVGGEFVGPMAHENSGAITNNGDGINPTKFAITAQVVNYTSGVVVWTAVWEPLGSGPAPGAPSGDNDEFYSVGLPALTFGDPDKEGLLTLTVDGVPCDGGGIEISIASPFYSDIAWGPVP